MKLTEFKKLIREEVERVLTEATVKPIDYTKLETALTRIPEDTATFSSKKGDGPKYIKFYIEDLKRIEKILKAGPDEFNNQTNLKDLKNLSKTQYGLEVYTTDMKTYRQLTDISIALDFSEDADEAAYANDYDALLAWWDKLSKMFSKLK
jgi:hypothetical protein